MADPSVHLSCIPKVVSEVIAVVTDADVTVVVVAVTFHVAVDILEACAVKTSLTIAAITIAVTVISVTVVYAIP